VLSVVQHPRGTSKRRIVANVLAVEAIEMCDPVAGVVSAESEDRPLHDRSVGERPRGDGAAGCERRRTFVIIVLALCTKSWEADLALDLLAGASFPTLVVSGSHCSMFDAVCDAL
jgi:hypothetical protein